VLLALEGRSIIGGHAVSHAAAPADDMQQAFSYHHLVTAQEFLISVSERWMARGGGKILSKTPLRITPGAATGIMVSLPPMTLFGALEFELAQPAEGFEIRSVTPTREGSEITVVADAGKVQTGLKGNLIVNVFLLRDRPAAATASAPATPAAATPAARRRVSLGSLPAVPFEVVAP
jgi:hypothetical protein